MVGIQYWKWRRLEGVEGRKRRSGWKRWENVREKFPLCPVSLRAASAWSSTTKTVQKGSQREKTLLWSFPGVDMSEKLIVFLPNHAGPWSPRSNHHKDWDDKHTSQKSLDSRLLFRDKKCLKYTVPLWRFCSLQAHVLLTVSWGSKGRSQHHVLRICLLEISGDTRECCELWGNIPHLPWRSSSSGYCILYSNNSFSIR